jgi:hypothetical protein
MYTVGSISRPVVLRLSRPTSHVMLVLGRFGLHSEGTSRKGRGQESPASAYDLPCILNMQKSQVVNLTGRAAFFFFFFFLGFCW